MCVRVLRLFVFSNIFFIHVYSTSRSEPILSFASFSLSLSFLCVYFILVSFFFRNNSYARFFFGCFLLQLYTVFSLSHSHHHHHSLFRVYIYVYIYLFIFIHHHLNGFLFLDTFHDDEMNSWSLFFSLSLSLVFTELI
jgi:hypothetical protein